MPTGHKWQPIEDISAPDALSDGELVALISVWKDQSSALGETDAVKKFSEQLNREWAIETGFIERVYSIDRGTTQVLIEKGIEASLIQPEGPGRSSEEIAAILRDHLDALEGMFAFVRGEREITVGYIKELHGALLRHVKTHTVRDSAGNFFEAKLEKGTYKTQPNSPTRADGTVHEYCPPEHVASEMDRLVEIHGKQVSANLPPEIQAAWLHHAFTQIHPFEDGNGRVARALASLVFVKAGGFPLVIRREDNAWYIAALEAADTGALLLFVEMLRASQRRVLIQALQALPWPQETRQSWNSFSPEETIAGIRNLLVRRGQGEVMPKEWEPTIESAQHLWNISVHRLTAIQNLLRVEIGRFKSEFRFDLNVNPDRTAADRALRWAREVAQGRGYDFTKHGVSLMAELTFQGDSGPRILVAIGGLGGVYRGVVGIVLTFISADGIGKLATDDLFQLNYKEARMALGERFKKWFEVGLTDALEIWRAQL